MKHCIACGRILPETSLFELTSAPASAQDIPDAKEVQNDEGVTLHLRQCSGCGLVQFDCEPVAYYRDVIRAGGGSSTMYIKDKGILNYPSDNRKFDHEGERRVYDIFFIRAEGAGNSTAANDAE